jgi:hypothetical protein
MSLFDALARVAFRSALKVMGEAITWSPSDGSTPLADTVLYNAPESLRQLGDTEKFDYVLWKYWFEFYSGQLPGLKASVDRGTTEVVTLQGMTLAVIQVTTSKTDKNTFIAQCIEYEQPI